MAIRAVLFDIGDTLWHAPNPPSPVEFRAMAAARAGEWLASAGLAAADPGVVSRIAWDAMEQAARKARRTTKVEPTYGNIARIALRRLKIDISSAQAMALLEAIYVSGPEGGKVAYPDAAATLTELKRRGFLLGMATNRSFGGDRFREDLRATGLDIGWDASAVSVEVGFMKPHRALFETVLGSLKVTPGEALMVGNSLAEDVAGAQALGIATAWKRSKADAEGVTPDIVFDEVSELLRSPLLVRTP